MNGRSVIVGMFLGALVGAGAPGFAAWAERDRLVRLLEQLGSEPRTCSSAGPARADLALCGSLDVDFERFRKLLRRASRRPADAALLEERRGAQGGLYGAKLLVSRAVLVELVFEPATGALTLRPPPGCLEPRGVDTLQDPRAGESFPVIDSRARAVFPEQARRYRRGGVVVLEAIVGTAGRVSEVCSLYVAPEGFGFEEAAREALHESRYEPARRDGRPVESRIRVATTFWLE